MQGPQCRGGGGPVAPARCEDVPQEAGVEREDDLGQEEELGLCLVVVASTFIPKHLSGVMCYLKVSFIRSNFGRRCSM